MSIHQDLLKWGDKIIKQQDFDEKSQIINTAIKTLEYRYQEAIKARYEKRWDKKESANRLGMTYRLFTIILNSAVKSLKNKLSDDAK